MTTLNMYAPVRREWSREGGWTGFGGIVTALRIGCTNEADAEFVVLVNITTDF